MSFRKRLQQLTSMAIVMIFAMPGCGYLMDNERPEPQGLDIPLDCLNRFDRQLKFFLDGTSEDGTKDPQLAADQFHQAIDCGDSALKFFVNHVRGEDRNEDVTDYNITKRYKPDELKNFFQAYILDDSELPDDLVTQLMALKMALFGGSKDDLSYEDILRIQKILRDLKKPASMLAPYMPLEFDRIKNKPVQYVKGLQRTLDQVGEEISRIFSGTVRSYSFASLRGLLESFIALYEKKEDSETPAFLLEHLEVLQTLKVMFVGKDETQIHQSQWRALIHMGLKLYGLQMYLSYIKHQSDQLALKPSIDQSELQQRHWLMMHDGVSQAIGLLGKALDSHEFDRVESGEVHEPIIRAQDAKSLVRAIRKTGVFPKTMQGEKFIEGIMALKVTIGGGDHDSITRDELKRLQEFFNDIKMPFIEFAALFPLDFDRASREDEAWVRDALGRLDAFGDRLSEIAQGRFNRYHWDDIEAFLNAMNSMRAEQSEKGLLNFILDHADLVQSLKEIFVGAPLDEIIENQWVSVIHALVDAYAVGLTLAHLQSEEVFEDGKTEARYERWGQGKALDLLNETIGRVERVFRRAMKLHPDEQIDFAVIERLVKALDQSSFLPEEITATSLQKTIEGAIQYILRDQQSDTEPEEITGFGPSAIDRVMLIWNNWSRRQKALEAIFLKEAGNDPDKLYHVTIRQRELVKTIGKLGPMYEDLRVMVESHPALFERNQEYITIDPVNKPTQMSFNGLTEINWVRSLGIFLLEGFIKDKDRRMPKGHLEISELEEFYSWARPLGIELKWVDPKHSDSPKLRGREADLFTPGANGDGIMDRYEGVQEFLYLLKGKSRGKQNHYELAEFCGESKDPENLDLFGYPLIDPQCYRDQFYDNANHYWRGLPGLISYYRSLTKEDKLAFQESYENAARKVGYNNVEKFKISDSEGYVILAYYLETVFYNFDRIDRATRKADGFLSWNELIPENEEDRNNRMWAFNVYDDVIIQIVKRVGFDLDYDDAQKVFMYLLINGKISKSKWKIGYWYHTYPNSKVKVSRLDIIRLIAALKNPQNAVAKEDGEEEDENHAKGELSPQESSDGDQQNLMQDIEKPGMIEKILPNIRPDKGPVSEANQPKVGKVLKNKKSIRGDLSNAHQIARNEEKALPNMDGVKLLLDYLNERWKKVLNQSMLQKRQKRVMHKQRRLKLQNPIKKTRNRNKASF